MEKTGMGASIGVDIKKAKGERNGKIGVRSIWETTITDKDGNIKSFSRDENLVTNQGLAALLDVMFMGGDQITDWYVLLTDGSGDSPTTSSTYAVPIFTEMSDITNAKRPVFTGVQTLGSITNNASKAVFTIDATSVTDLLGGALVGALTGADVIGNVAASNAILYCAIDFAELKSIVATDVVSIAITMTATGY